jgi:hypothetical protein
MSSPATGKICVKCGTDCSNKPRTKDPQGRYTCKACFDALAAKAAAAKAAPKPKPADPIPIAEPDDAAVMARLLESSPSLTEMCPSCGSGMPVGAVVCTICGYDKNTGRTATARPEPDATGGTKLAKAASIAVTPMAWAFSVVGAVIGGAIGAVVWAAVAYGLHREISWIAMGVGLVTGFGAALPAGKRAGAVTGLIAAVVALGAIVAGKYVATSMIVDDLMNKELRTVARHQIDDGDMLTHLARDIAKEQTDQGKPLTWPDGVDPKTAAGEEEFPAPVWKEAKASFAAMSASDKDQLQAHLQAKFNQDMKGMVEQIKAEGFSESFSLFDILWFGLALVFAFSAGSGARMSSDKRSA